MKICPLRQKRQEFLSKYKWCHYLCILNNLAAGPNLGHAVHIEIASARFASIAMTFSFGR